MASKFYENKRLLITAGPTYERIDPVRFIGNFSSGKMGIAIADEAARRGASVDLVLGPTHHLPAEEGVTVHKVTSAQEMYDSCHALFDSSDVQVMAAAVADYRPAEMAEEKIKKSGGGMTIELVRTKDILASLGAIKKDQQVLVGFALETENELENAMGKLERKNADLIVLNSMKDEGAGFGHDTNRVTILDKRNNLIKFGLKSKAEVACDILDRIESYANED